MRSQRSQQSNAKFILDRCRRAARPAAIAICTLVLLGSALAPAQTTLFRWGGTPQPSLYGDYFGGDFAGVGDVNGDGVPDIAVGAASTNVESLFGTIESAGRLYVFSGADGSTLFTVDGTSTYENVAWQVKSAGDVNADGLADILVSFDTLDRRGFHLVSGVDGTILNSYLNYESADGIGDVNGDGWGDLLFGLAGASWNPGTAYVISGLDGSTIRSFSGTYVLQNFGLPVARAGDVDGDGKQDLLIGANGSWPWNGADGIWVYSGRTGALLFRKPPPPLTDTFPSDLVAVGDTNGDGLDEVGVVDYGYRQGAGTAKLSVFGMSSLSPMAVIQGTSTSYGGKSAGPGDVDGDGFDDILLQNVWPNLVQLRASQSQIVLMNLVTGGPVAAAGDVNGDDFPDYLVGGFTSPLGLNEVRLYSGAPTGVTAFGQGCAGGNGVIPRIGCTYKPIRGSTFRLQLSRARPSAQALCVLGVSNTFWNTVPLPLDLSMLGMPACSLLVSGEDSTLITTTGIAANNGHATRLLQIPNLTALVGSTFYSQSFVLEPPGSPTLASTTRALAVTIQ
jgi:hypothetical protein